MTEQEQEEKRRRDLTKHDTEQAEMMVKPSPKKKPPRTDKDRRRIDTPDNDLNKKDPDLSLNRKDIGGSLERRVLLRMGFEFTPVDTIMESDAKPLKKPKKKPLRLDPEKEKDLILQRLRDEDSSEIINQALCDDPIALKALAYLRSPFPPRWKRNEVFQHGQLSLESRVRFRNHMILWDELSFVRNWIFLRERCVNESLTSGSQFKADYYTVLMHMVGQSYYEFLQKGEPLVELEDCKDLYQESPEMFQLRLRRTSNKVLKQLLKMSLPDNMLDMVRTEKVLRDQAVEPRTLLLKLSHILS
jgi:hypothetical protein